MRVRDGFLTLMLLTPQCHACHVAKTFTGLPTAFELMGQLDVPDVVIKNPLAKQTLLGMVSGKVSAKVFWVSACSFYWGAFVKTDGNQNVEGPVAQEKRRLSF